MLVTATEGAIMTNPQPKPANTYAHDTREGWCCACEAEIAFALSYIKDEPEFMALVHQAETAVEQKVWQKLWQFWIDPLNDDMEVEALIKSKLQKEGK